MKFNRIVLILLLVLPAVLTQDEPVTEDGPAPASADNEVATDAEGAADPTDEIPAPEEDAPVDEETTPVEPDNETSALSLEGGTGGMSKFRDVKADGKTVCNALKTVNEDKMKVNLTGTLSYEDMLKLMTWSLKYDLKSGKKAFKFGKEMDKKREVLDLIAAVFKKGCPGEYVPEGFINIAKELSMIYLNSVKSKKKSKSDWESTLTALKKCPELTKQLKFSSVGFQADSFFIRNKNDMEESLKILPPMEIADEYFHSMDIIVDTMWWMFSYAFATCSPHMESKAIGMAKFKKLFYNDFLVGLIPRWKRGGRWTMAYGPIFGDMDISRTLINIRFCVTAAYTQSAIADRQLVRPISIVENIDGVISSYPNRKTGELFA